MRTVPFLVLLAVLLVAAGASAATPDRPAPAATPAPPDGSVSPDVGSADAGAADDDWDDEDDAELDQLFDVDDSGGGWEEEQKPRTYPWFEHHGYFRFRSDLFWRAHLGTDAIVHGTFHTVTTSGFHPPLSHNEENNPQTGGSGIFDPNDVGRGRKDETIAGANMRFRYTPTIHLTEDLRIVAQFDVLDNIVLGSTPDFAGTLSDLRPDVPLIALTGSQVPPESGRTGFKDSIRVKQAYGEWNSLIGLLRFGRTAVHWGLGVMHNGGQGADSDFGDYVDRVMWMARFWGVYVLAAWDFASEGPTSESPSQFYGQAYDLDQADDVNQWVLAIFQRPISEEEQARRKKDLDERRVPVLDWGLYTLFRRQDLDITSVSGTLGSAAPGYDWDTVQFVQRDAWVLIPDLWLRFEWRPRYGRRLHIELEAVFAYGRLNVANGTSLSEVEIMQYGGVLRADYMMGGLSFGIELGLASGDDTEGFGVLDRSTVTEADGKPTRRLSSFVFDRDFHTDLLLFREVMGAVTNTVYFKPWVQYDLFEGDEDALGARLDILYARALEPAATPGNDSNLGVELEVRIFYEEKGRFLAMLEWGMLFPLDAFNLPSEYFGYSGDGIKAQWATTLQARLAWMF